MVTNQPPVRIQQADAALLETLNQTLKVARDLVNAGYSIQDVQVAVMGDPVIHLMYSPRNLRLGGHVTAWRGDRNGNYKRWATKYGPVYLTWNEPARGVA